MKSPPFPATTSGPGLSAQVGVGLKPEHADALLDGAAGVGFLEIHAENYMVPGGPMHAMLTRLRERYPLSVHGVGLSLGGPDPLDEELLAGHRRLRDRYAPALVSEHLAWSRGAGVFFNDLLPFPYDGTTLRRTSEHIDAFQNSLGRRILIENPATYLRFDASLIDEAQFLGELVARTGCGLLLDVNNVYVSAVNHGFDARGYLSLLPLGSVEEIHLAGHHRQVEPDGGVVLIDSHDAPIAEPVWALYETALRATGPVATLIERDGNIPPLTELLHEAARVQACLAKLDATLVTPP